MVVDPNDMITVTENTDQAEGAAEEFDGSSELRKACWYCTFCQAQLKD